MEVEFRTRPPTQVFLNEQLQPAQQGKVTLHRADFLTGQREDQRRLEFRDPQGDYQTLTRELRWDQLQEGAFPAPSEPPLQLMLRAPLQFDPFIRAGTRRQSVKSGRGLAKDGTSDT